ncbi:MAG: hypothetical protein QOI66_4445 [Myxococcales bacterium]|jgi:pSer/pThr/pTyr-binding forkhead associated (FHA) protein/uncharacterized protein involved in exopolysaccharide biosynthesis|nr:hypothetical protein [Myxococcales bacterium]
MASHPSNKDGAEGDEAHGADSGLDAKLDRAVPAGAPEAFLLGVGEGHGGRVYPLNHNTVYLGRADDADVVIADASVSGRHARIINGSQGFEVEDLGSTNGTWVEGRRVMRTRLHSGDRLTLGNVEFKFLVDKRLDATMMILSPGSSRGRPATGTLIRYESPRSRLEGTSSFVPAKQRDEDEGPSLEEIFGRLARAYRFVQKNAALFRMFAVAGVLLGLLSAVILPAPREAVCILKLQPQLKANPFDAQWNRGSNEDQEVRFFSSVETAFVQPVLVEGTLTKVLGQKPSTGTVTSVAGRLKIESKPDNVYQATYKEAILGSTPVGSAEFLAAHIENYLHGEIARAIRVFTAQADFLRDQLKTVEGDMKNISDQRMKFSQQNSDRLPEGAGPMLGSSLTLETRRAELTAQIRKLQGELDAHRHALADGGPLAQNRFKASQVYRESLATINRKLTESYARGLADGHPEVRELKDEKVRIEGLIENEMGSETTPLDRESNAGYQELKSKVALLQAQLSGARSDLADTEKNLTHVHSVVGDLPRVQAGVQRLTHMQDATTQLHGQLFEQLKKAELQLNLERVSAESRYEVVLAPQLVKTGWFRNAVVRLIIGLVLGVFLALATILVRKVRHMFLHALSKTDSSPTSSAP